MTIEIVEVLRRSEQGMTRPHICRGSDGGVYFVKGHEAGRTSLIKEWICGSLAQAMGLPIPPFQIVDIPDELITPDTNLELEALGSGLCFGSQERELTTELRFSQIDLVPAGTRRDIAVFDRWIRNYDRSLTVHGGNPNLLWANDEQSVVIIDHNNAFDTPCDRATFAAEHIFGQEFLQVCADAATIASYRERLNQALSDWGSIVASVPETWMFVDSWKTVAVDFNFDHAREVLCEHCAEGLWT